MSPANKSSINTNLHRNEREFLSSIEIIFFNKVLCEKKKRGK